MMRIRGRMLSVVLFFFQAEDGIRDATVTGVQTCALPISVRARVDGRDILRLRHYDGALRIEKLPRQLERRARFRPAVGHETLHRRSEERRVGKECRYRWSLRH